MELKTLRGTTKGYQTKQRESTKCSKRSFRASRRLHLNKRQRLMSWSKRLSRPPRKISGTRLKYLILKIKFSAWKMPWRRWIHLIIKTARGSYCKQSSKLNGSRDLSLKTRRFSRWPRTWPGFRKNSLRWLADKTNCRKKIKNSRHIIRSSSRSSTWYNKSHKLSRNRSSSQ